MSENLKLPDKPIDMVDASFKSLKQTIKRILNFESENYSDSFFLRRVQVRMRAKNASTFSQYESLFIKDLKEQEELLKNLSIHVTEFFRDESFWEFCKTKFFKDVILKCKNKNTINIWSAGCSSGQEAISILITFLEIDQTLKEKIRITCTDISAQVIEKAKTLDYDTIFENKGLKNEITEKYFNKLNNCIQLKPEYKQNFTFIKHDILNDALLPNMDVIFLRNTVIYFSKEFKEDLYERIFYNLPTSGFFILGKTETLNGPAKEKFSIYESRERIFQKP